MDARGATERQTEEGSRRARREIAKLNLQLLRNHGELVTL